jgi:hypothetical protein
MRRNDKNILGKFFLYRKSTTWNGRAAQRGNGQFFHRVNYSCIRLKKFFSLQIARNIFTKHHNKTT